MGLDYITQGNKSYVNDLPTALNTIYRTKTAEIDAL